MRHNCAGALGRVASDQVRTCISGVARRRSGAPANLHRDCQITPPVSVNPYAKPNRISVTEPQTKRVMRPPLGAGLGAERPEAGLLASRALIVVLIVRLLRVRRTGHIDGHSRCDGEHHEQIERGHRIDQTARDSANTPIIALVRMGSRD